jgi:serine/threonine-protein kinase
MTDREIYEFGEFRLDVPERRLSKAAEPIPLTPKAHDVLTALVRHAGRLVTKPDLLNTIWPDAFVEEGILAVHISTLRRALGDAGRPPVFIETVSRSGYRFISPVRRVDPSTTSPSLRTLAVLPFRPLLAESSDAALELGIADSMITRLGTNEGLVVRPLSAVRRYATLEQDPLSAGRELNVQFVLDGTVHRSRNALRITVRLLRVADSTSGWSQTFDRGFADIFSIEEAVARGVVAAIGLKPTDAAPAIAAKSQTRNSDAYLLFLRGRHLWERRGRETIDKAIAYYRAALEKDPRYALAYNGLATCYATLTLITGTPPRDAFPNAKAAILKALDIDDGLAEAHASLAGVHFWYEWNAAAAEREFRVAARLDRGSPSVARFFAHFLSNVGRHDEALRESHRALALDPLSALNNARHGQFLYQAGEFDAALDQLIGTLELDNSSSMVHLNLGRVYERMGKHSEALAALRKASGSSNGTAEAKAVLGHMLAVSGEDGEARIVLAELERDAERGCALNYNLALVSAGLRRQEDVHRHLARALEERETGMTFLKVEPRWRPYRDEAWFRQILAEVGLWE